LFYVSMPVGDGSEARKIEKPGSCLSGFSARSFGKLRGLFAIPLYACRKKSTSTTGICVQPPTGHCCPEGWTFCSPPLSHVVSTEA
jgi:hypothetical protein